MASYTRWNGRTDFSKLLGLTLASVAVNEAQDEIRFTTDQGLTYLMYHEQDCCEGVSIESIVGDLQDLIGNPILKADEVVSDEAQPGQEVSQYDDSFTWTFYKLATIKGYVDIRWLGSSNGYYSEGVDFMLESDNT
jgi:hypothetical protein